MTTAKQRVLSILTEQDVSLPDDGLTIEKISTRGTHFQFEKGKYLGFRLERHPTMYLSDSQPGRHQSPARFHVTTVYRLTLDDKTWSIEEIDSTFEFTPHLVIEAELDADGIRHAVQKEIEATKRAENSENAFEEAFRPWVNHWEDKFAEVHGRPVPANQQEEIVQLLVDELRSRAGLS